MTNMEAVNQIVDYKYKLLHLKKLLGDVKSVIELYKSNNKDDVHFDRIMKELDANGVKGTYDSLTEYRKYMEV
jgi:ABC-type uncharacterized transport system substrate-binding protein